MRYLLPVTLLLLSACTSEDASTAATLESADLVAIEIWTENMGPVSDACADVVERAEVSRVASQGAMDYACPDVPGAIACTDYQGEGKPGRPMPVIIMGPDATADALVHEFAHVLSACELGNPDPTHAGAAWDFYLESGE